MLKIKVSEDDILWALYTAEIKTKNTFDSWKKRSECQRFLDIFIGDLAKNIVRTKLIEMYPNIKKYLEEYDRLRDDGFKNNDQYDLRLLGKYIIEVKSSFEKYTKNIKTIKERRNIIINKENCHESESDYVFQVFYINDDLNWFKGISDDVVKFKSLIDLKEVLLII